MGRRNPQQVRQAKQLRRHKRTVKRVKTVRAFKQRLSERVLREQWAQVMQETDGRAEAAPPRSGA